MGQTKQSNNFTIYNISLHYDIQFSFNELGIQKITQIIEKNINQITFYFVEEGPGCSSEDIRKNVMSTVLIFSSFLSFGWMSWEEKSQSIQKNCTKIEK